MMRLVLALAALALSACGAPEDGADVAEFEGQVPDAKWQLRPQGNQSSGSGSSSGACIELGTSMVYYDETSTSDGKCCRSNGLYRTLHEQYWNTTVYYCY